MTTIVGNLVLLARGAAPQHQEYLHDAVMSTSSSIHILYSPDVTEQGSDQLDSIHPRVMFVTAQSDGADISLTYIPGPSTISPHSSYSLQLLSPPDQKSLNRIQLHNQSILPSHASPSRINTKPNIKVQPQIPHLHPQSCLPEP